MTDPGDPDTPADFSIDPALEARLTDLGPELAVPAGDTLMAEVTSRLGLLEADPPTHPGSFRANDRGNHRPRRLLVAAAAIVLAVLAGLIAYGPSRSAIADWLGIGAVRLRPVAPLPPLPPPPASVGRRVPPSAFADARRHVSFPIVRADPARTAPPIGIDTDERVPGGLVSLTYDRFTLTEIAAQPDGQAIAVKLLPPGADVEYVVVNGRNGAWISGAVHELGYLDPNGAYRSETVRRVGNVLLWEDGGVTYRIEGLDSRDEALAVAAGLR